MTSSLTALLQLAFSLLLAVQTASSTSALQQQAISTVNQAVQLVAQAVHNATPASSPSLLTYVNNQDGFSFEYPSTDSLTKSTRTSLLFDVSNPPGDTMVIAVTLPSSTYGDQSASWTNTRDVEVWWNNTTSGTALCLTQYGRSDVSAAFSYPSTKMINGSNWVLNSGSEDNMTTETDGIRYQTLHNGVCYSTRYMSTNYPNDFGPPDISAQPTDFEPTSATQSDEQQNQSTYLQILNSFTFLK